MSISGKLLVLNSASNLSEIIQLDKEDFPRPWSEADWKNLDFKHHLLFSWQDTCFSGFSLFHRVGDDPTAHLLKICLIPELRGKGVAITLWNEIALELRSRGVISVYLEVEKSNISAVKFYLKLGFQLYREIPGYYTDGATAMTMGLML